MSAATPLPCDAEIGAARRAERLEVGGGHVGIEALGLVHREPHAPAAPAQQLRGALGPRACGRAGVNEEDDGVGLVERAQRLARHEPVETVVVRARPAGPLSTTMHAPPTRP